MLADKNSNLVSSAFTSLLPNAKHQRIRHDFPMPDLEATQCPQLDLVFKSLSSLKAEARTIDIDLGKIQAFVLDPLSPLACLLQSTDERNVSLEEVRYIFSEALVLLGNSSSQISNICRKRILKADNPDMQDLADEHNQFKTASQIGVGEIEG
jgi:hypothetical protein